MKNIAHVLFATTALAFAAHASAQVTFYDQDGFQGRTFSTQHRVSNLQRSGFNDSASVGGGSGQQIATVGGAVGGAALGAQYAPGRTLVVHRNGEPRV